VHGSTTSPSVPRLQAIPAKTPCNLLKYQEVADSQPQRENITEPRWQPFSRGPPDSQAMPYPAPRGPPPQGTGAHARHPRGGTRERKVRARHVSLPPEKNHVVPVVLLGGRPRRRGVAGWMGPRVRRAIHARKSTMRKINLRSEMRITGGPLPSAIRRSRVRVEQRNHSAASVSVTCSGSAAARRRRSDKRSGDGMA